MDASAVNPVASFFPPESGNQTNAESAVLDHEIERDDEDEVPEATAASPLLSQAKPQVTSTMTDMPSVTTAVASSSAGGAITSIAPIVRTASVAFRENRITAGKRVACNTSGRPLMHF